MNITMEGFRAIVGGAAIVLLAIEQVRLSLEVQKILREMEKPSTAATEQETLHKYNLSIAQRGKERKREA